MEHYGKCGQSCQERVTWDGLGFPGWRSSRRPSWQSTHSPLNLCLLGKGIPEHLVCGRHGAKCFPCFLYDLFPRPPPASSGVLCHRVHCPDKETMAGGGGALHFQNTHFSSYDQFTPKRGLEAIYSPFGRPCLSAFMLNFSVIFLWRS